MITPPGFRTAPSGKTLTMRGIAGQNSLKPRFAGIRKDESSPDVRQDRLPPAQPKPGNSEISRRLFLLLQDWSQTAGLKGLLDKGLNPDMPDAAGNTLLMHAVNKNKPESISLLIQAGADINLRNPRTGYSPLLVAISLRKKESLDRLLAAPRLDVNTTDNMNRSALMHAVAGGQTELVRRLLARGANPVQADKDGLSPLALACRYDLPEEALLLLDHGANPNQKDADGDTPLIFSAKRGNAELTELLLDRGAKVNHRGADGDTALLWAVSKGHLAAARSLLHRGADPNLEQALGYTPLAEALFQQNRAMVWLLLGNGADLNRIDSQGKTLLTRSISEFGSNTVDFILALDPDINQPDAQGITPLKQAILSRRPEVVEMLLACPHLMEVSKLDSTHFRLGGPSSESVQNQWKLAQTLTSPDFAQTIRENPTLDLTNIFQRLGKNTQALRHDYKLRMFQSRLPQAYQTACLEMAEALRDADESEVSPKNAFDRLRARADEAFRETAGGIRILPPRMRTALPGMALFEQNAEPRTPADSDTIHGGLMYAQYGLMVGCPMEWNQIGLGVLFNRFEQDEQIQSLRNMDPAGYQIAARTYHQMTYRVLDTVQEFPELMEGLSPEKLEPAFRETLAEAIRNEEIPEAFPGLDRLFALARQEKKG